MEKEYNKPALDITGLIKHIRAKKIIIEDDKKAAFYLQTVSHHRLLPYLDSLVRNHHSPKQLTFDRVWELYCFDRELRLLINDAIERIEVAFRTSLSETMSYHYSPHWFLQKIIFKNSDRYIGFMEQVDFACRNKHNSSIQEYFKHYNYPKYPSSWIIFECLSFGTCVSAFTNIKHLKDRKAICNIFKEHPTTMQSWLYAIRYMRNLCAHHARVWNRWFVVSPALSFMLGDDFNKQNTCYAHLFILSRLLKKVSPYSIWEIRLKHLLEMNKSFPIHEMGFAKNLQNNIIWDENFETNSPNINSDDYDELYKVEAT